MLNSVFNQLTGLRASRPNSSLKNYISPNPIPYSRKPIPKKKEKKKKQETLTIVRSSAQTSTVAPTAESIGPFCSVHRLRVRLLGEVTFISTMQLEEKVPSGDESNPCLSKSTRLPRKRFYRARAHSNPLSDSHFPVPTSPLHVDYSLHFPHFFPSPDSQSSSKKVEFADIGCGFGGLLISLATLFPDTLMIGMELRDKVTEYVKERILALRVSNPGQYQNVSVVRTNSMKYIPNYFEKAQLSKMFFLFPDPHFKERNHRRRVISPFLLDEYAYAIKPGGIIYTITDVEELGE
ncbi:putative tRNA (guanine(46)-N(7))-methyltransferase [Helianthus annuus]|uniref:tRNA (guanine-N(7)-)-methyltransferase n=1 Tax=Helianthus annuus TaxID=4232 RepID=A0A251SGH6_HELAN|nr:putative tRNA (guanine(46)-N(7))-methyltransferase [Helianthus annuus]